MWHLLYDELVPCVVFVSGVQRQWPESGFPLQPMCVHYCFSKEMLVCVEPRTQRVHTQFHCNKNTLAFTSFSLLSSNGRYKRTSKLYDSL